MLNIEVLNRILEHPDDLARNENNNKLKKALKCAFTAVKNVDVDNEVIDADDRIALDDSQKIWMQTDSMNRRLFSSLQEFIPDANYSDDEDDDDDGDSSKKFKKSSKKINREKSNRDEGDCEDDEDDEDDEDADLSNINDIYYDDFFGKKMPKSVRMDENSDEGEGEDEEDDDFDDKDEEYDEVDDNDYTQENLELQKSVHSLFEERQRRLKNKISNIEKRALAPKQWQMMGEVTAQDRPVDSLLETNLEFAKGVREVPIKSAEVSRTLLAIIDQRSRDQSWDDVVRKEKPKLAKIKYERKQVISQEKSKQSLAAIYEESYGKKLQDLQMTEEERKALSDQPFYETEDELRIERKWKQVSDFLDTLTNFRFIPRAAVGRQTVQVTGTPAFTREDVVPITTQAASQLAPEEVFRKPKGGVLVAKEELTRTDKNRQNRKRKKKQSAIAAAAAAKKQKLDAKAAAKSKSELKSSSTDSPKSIKK